MTTTLEKLSLGDSDTGNGGRLSDDVVQSLVAAAPNLRVLSLDACTQLTDATLIAALTQCPRLELLAITGNDKVGGRITRQALKTLKDQPTLGPALKELVLYDQRGDGLDNAAQTLTAAPSSFAVKTGETLGYVALPMLSEKSFTATLTERAAL